MVGYGDNGNGTYYLDSGKMQENLEKAIEDAEIEIMNAKTVVCRAAEREYHTSGIYTYYIVEGQKKRYLFVRFLQRIRRLSSHLN